MDDLGQEIVENDILIVEANQFLNIFKSPAGIVREHSIVEAKKQTLKLRNDAVLDVSWIADERPTRVRIVARQIFCLRIAATPDGISEEEGIAAIIKIRLVVRSAPIYVVQVEGWRPKIR